MVCARQAHAWQPKAAPPKAAPPKVAVKARLPEEPHSEVSWSITQALLMLDHIRDHCDMWEVCLMMMMMMMMMMMIFGRFQQFV